MQHRINFILNIQQDNIWHINCQFKLRKFKINKIITELLGEPLARFYRIEGIPGEPFKINIDKNLIDILY